MKICKLQKLVKSFLRPVIKHIIFKIIQLLHFLLQFTRKLRIYYIDTTKLIQTKVFGHLLINRQLTHVKCLHRITFCLGKPQNKFFI